MTTREQKRKAAIARIVAVHVESHQCVLKLQKVRDRLRLLMKRLRKYSCPSATASDEFVNGWDAATEHCAERIEQILRKSEEKEFSCKPSGGQHGS